jgi:hypothetical protein
VESPHINISEYDISEFEFSCPHAVFKSHFTYFLRMVNIRIVRKPLYFVTLFGTITVFIETKLQ